MFGILLARPTGLTFRLVRPDPETPAKTETTKPNASTTNLNVQAFLQLLDFVRIIAWVWAGMGGRFKRQKGAEFSSCKRVLPGLGSVRTAGPGDAEGKQPAAYTYAQINNIREGYPRGHQRAHRALPIRA